MPWTRNPVLDFPVSRTSRIAGSVTAPRLHQITLHIEDASVDSKRTTDLWGGTPPFNLPISRFLPHRPESCRVG